MYDRIDFGRVMSLDDKMQGCLLGSILLSRQVAVDILRCLVKKYWDSFKIPPPGGTHYS